MKSPRSLKQDKLVNSSKNAAGRLSVRNVPSQRIHGIRVGQPMNTSRGSAENRTAKDPIPKPNRCQYTAAASLKPLKTSKVPRHMAEVNVTNSARISESVSTKAMGSRTKHSQPTMSSHSQNRKLSHVSIEFSTESTCRKRQGDARSQLPDSNSCFSRIDTVFASNDQSPVKHDSLQQVSDNKVRMIYLVFVVSHILSPPYDHHDFTPLTTNLLPFSFQKELQAMSHLQNLQYH